MPAKKKTAKKAAPKKTAKPAAKPAPSKPDAKATKATKPAKSATNGKAEAPKPEPDAKTKEIVLGARRRSNTPAMFKVKKGKTPVVFTMEDVAHMLEHKKPEKEEKPTAKKTAAKTVLDPVEESAPVENRSHSAASLADILGFNPAESRQSNVPPGRQVPRKWQKHYKLLLELRQHVTDELEIHTAETLKRSNRDDSGDLSGYGQHMADAGTDTFDRDFALSLVSNEQEALYEIEEAIQRIFDDAYGMCEHTGEPIDKERLLAVPFTRYSLEGQRQMERTRKSKSQRGGVFADSDDDLSLGGDDDDN